MELIKVKCVGCKIYYLFVGHKTGADAYYHYCIETGIEHKIEVER